MVHRPASFVPIPPWRAVSGLRMVLASWLPDHRSGQAGSSNLVNCFLCRAREVVTVIQIWIKFVTRQVNLHNTPFEIIEVCSLFKKVLSFLVTEWGRIKVEK